MDKIIAEIDKLNVGKIDLLAIVSKSSSEIVFYCDKNGRMIQSNNLIEEGLIDSVALDTFCSTITCIIRNDSKFREDKMNIVKVNRNNKGNNKSNNKKNVETSKTEKGKKKGFWKRHRKLALFLKICIVLIILLIIVGAGAVVAIFTNDDWAMTKEDLTLKYVDTIIYDKDGNEIANVSGEEKRRTVPLSEIPKTVQDADLPKS